jgi:hypothetical protein
MHRILATHVSPDRAHFPRVADSMEAFTRQPRVFGGRRPFRSWQLSLELSPTIIRACSVFASMARNSVDRAIRRSLGAADGPNIKATDMRRSCGPAIDSKPHLVGLAKGSLPSADQALGLFLTSASKSTIHIRARARAPSPLQAAWKHSRVISASGPGRR